MNSDPLWKAGNAAAKDGVKWWDNPHPAGSVEAYRWDQGHTHHRLALLARPDTTPAG